MKVTYWEKRRKAGQTKSRKKRKEVRVGILREGNVSDEIGISRGKRRIMLGDIWGMPGVGLMVRVMGLGS